MKTVLTSELYVNGKELKG